jgi:hypothetical protein
VKHWSDKDVLVQWNKGFKGTLLTQKLECRMNLKSSQTNSFIPDPHQSKDTNSFLAADRFVTLSMDDRTYEDVEVM